MTINRIEAGATFAFETGLSGTDTGSFTTTMAVMQYPGDTPAISRTITDSTDTLTSAETTALYAAASPKTQPWAIHIRSVDSDEDVRQPVRLYVQKGWL